MEAFVKYKDMLCKMNKGICFLAKDCTFYAIENLKAGIFEE